MNNITQEQINTLWYQCLKYLEGDISNNDINTWIKPLQLHAKNKTFHLLAPNNYVHNQVKSNFLGKIESTLSLLSNSDNLVILEIGSRATQNKIKAKQPIHSQDVIKSANEFIESHLDQNFNFDNFVEGKSNQIAKAASIQVSNNPGGINNPLFIYGCTGLGKTHLMHAIGNTIIMNNSNAKVVYLHSEKFVAEMVRSLQHNAISEFKKFYRSVNALLIDDIQFFAGKDRSQEEFFHTFNALFETKQQIILTCDRSPKEVQGLEDRLKSRFGWGLTIAIEPPDLETRVAILLSKSKIANINLPHNVAFVIAKKIRANVRELEGALRRLHAYSQFVGNSNITVDFAKEALRDLLSVQDKLITIENIQKTTADFYKIRVNDLSSKKRSQTIARPRQIAMALTKELTNHSLPEIGKSFNRDHTTVLHACRKINELRKTDNLINEDYKMLLKKLEN